MSRAIRTAEANFDVFFERLGSTPVIWEENAKMAG